MSIQESIKRLRDGVKPKQVSEVRREDTFKVCLQIEAYQMIVEGNNQKIKAMEETAEKIEDFASEIADHLATGNQLQTDACGIKKHYGVLYDVAQQAQAAIGEIASQRRRIDRLKGEVTGLHIEIMQLRQALTAQAIAFSQRMPSGKEITQIDKQREEDRRNDYELNVSQMFGSGLRTYPRGY